MHKPTLLFAEDNAETRENYTFILKEYFSEIYQAKNGKEALDYYRRYKPDILLFDIKMPYLNGLEVTRLIRADDLQTPIIMLTAYSDQETLLQAVELKLDGFLLKPIDPGRLQTLLLDLAEKITISQTVALLPNLTWDGHSHKLFYRENEIKLTKKERQLLAILCTKPGSYHTHDELIINIWEDDLPDHTFNKKLVQLIYRLNKKITELLPDTPKLIENSYTLGYKVHTIFDI